MKGGRASTDPPARNRRDLSVFINCPYDALYQNTFDALIFTVMCSGFEPRSALETDTTSDARMQRIMASLRASRFSIHDLSRCKGEGKENLSRFNMPFDRGIAMGMKEASAGAAASRWHDWTALVPEGVRYQSVISDLNGYDLKRYGSRETLVAKVMAWLSTRFMDFRMHVTPVQVIAALPDYDAALKTLREQWKNAETWVDVVQNAQQVAASCGLTDPLPRAPAQTRQRP
jgi:hypothetical protein